MNFGEENVGKFTIANINYSGIWLDKILTNGIRFAKFAKVSPCQNFALYDSAWGVSHFVFTGAFVCLDSDSRSGLGTADRLGTGEFWNIYNRKFTSSIITTPNILYT